MTTFKEKEQKRFDETLHEVAEKSYKAGFLTYEAERILGDDLSASHLRLLELVEERLPKETTVLDFPARENSTGNQDMVIGFNTCLAQVKAVILKAKEEVR